MIPVVLRAAFVRARLLLAFVISRFFIAWVHCSRISLLVVARLHSNAGNNDIAIQARQLIVAFRYHD